MINTFRVSVVPGMQFYSDVRKLTFSAVTAYVPLKQYFVRLVTVNVLKFQSLYAIPFCLNFGFYAFIPQNTWWSGKWFRCCLDCSFRSSLIEICTVCICYFNFYVISQFSECKWDTQQNKYPIFIWLYFCYIVLQ